MYYYKNWEHRLKKRCKKELYRRKGLNDRQCTLRARRVDHERCLFGAELKKGENRGYKMSAQTMMNKKADRTQTLTLIIVQLR
jgi:hypothetical protein